MAVAGAIAALFCLPVVAVLAIAMLGGGSSAASCGPPAGADGPPATMIPIYNAAAAKYGLGPDGWAYLAGLEYAESRFGANTGGSEANAFRGGLYQFIAPTWAAYNADPSTPVGEHASHPYDAAAVMNPTIATFSAANYLHASGAPADWQAALMHWNNSPAEWGIVRAKVAEYTTIGADGLAAGVSCDETPAGDGSVASITAAADELDRMHVPYNFGGGHLDPARPTAGQDGPRPGLDCSSSVSWVLQHAGLRVPTMTSGAFMTWGDPGPGRYVTIYTHTQHIIMSIRDASGRERFFGTSGFGHPAAGTGPAWFTEPVSQAYLDGTSTGMPFVRRHPPGL